MWKNILRKVNNQSILYSSCYNNNKNKFDWIFLNDIDEYLVIKNDTLKNYLSNKIFKQCYFISIHLIKPTDIIYYTTKKKPLFQSFKGPYINTTYIKSFVRGRIKRFKYYIDSPSSSLRNICCNNIGKNFILINHF